MRWYHRDATVSAVTGVRTKRVPTFIRTAVNAAVRSQGDAMVLLSVEKYYFRDAEGYETARRATVWNGLLPDRFPDVIVQAHDTGDVVAAIRYARANGHMVGVCSGGHS